MKYYFYHLELFLTDGTKGDASGIIEAALHCTPKEIWDALKGDFIGKTKKQDNDGQEKTIQSILAINFYKVEA